MRTRLLLHLQSELIECECGCGELIHAINQMGKSAKFKVNHCMKGEGNANYKFGRTMHADGYILVKNYTHPFRNSIDYVFEHRLIWEESNQAMILPWGIIHHINEIRTDNRPENLQAMMRNQHPKIHFAKDFSNRRCVRCEGMSSNRGNKVNSAWIHGLCNKCYLRNRRANKNYR